MSDDRRVVLGRISGVFGVQGWVKVHSHTQPRDNIVSYPHWRLRGGADGPAVTRDVTVEEGRLQGPTVVARLSGIGDRGAALALMGASIDVARSELPPPAEGEYYWTDLEDLLVRTREGVELGRVVHLLETPVHDVLVVRGERERLVPFVRGRYVLEVDLEAKLIVVDWDPEF